MTNHNNTNAALSEFIELSTFRKYQTHLADTLSYLKHFLSPIRFLEVENKKSCEDFFFSNLFILHDSLKDNCISDISRKDIEEMWDNLKLYHYTDSPSLEKIISTKTLRLNCLTKMNDSAEGLALKEKFLPLLKNTPQFKNDPSCEKIFNQLTSKHLNNCYASSFTVLSNDASQWDRYGNPNKSKKNECADNHVPTKIESAPCGVCLEIHISKLLELVKMLEDDFDWAEIIPIFYVPRDQNDNPCLAFGDNSFLNYIRSCGLGWLKANQSKDAIRTIIIYSSNIKYQSFRKEYEVRLLLSLTDDIIPKLTYISSTSDEDKEKGKRYITIKFNELNPEFSFSEFFTSITLGPETSPEARCAVEELLKKHKLQHLLKEQDSNCTLRT
ncbi:hypothetical protein [Ruminobacter sp.]|uniref:hypothetical protein n=1 Tax=Ruminobacter sp. TaxID=2774296 RepID=UPI003866CED3